MADDNAHPYAHTRAARMLGDALKHYTAGHSGGLRALAASLGMKQAVNLSHMANGRMPIPLERATELSAILELNVAEFCLAVLEQRAPSVRAALEQKLNGGTIASLSDQAHRAIKVISHASPLSDEQVEVITEVVADRRPAERWLELSEVPVIAMIRRQFPNGLKMSEQESLRAGIEIALGLDL